MNPTQTHRLNPGSGAEAFARERVDGLTRKQATPIVRELIAELPADKRVKRCDYCRYPFYDVSLRNTRRTCCDECNNMERLEDVVFNEIVFERHDHLCFRRF